MLSSSSLRKNFFLICHFGYLTVFIFFGCSITGNNLYLHSFISANLHRCFKTNRWYVVAKCQNSLVIVLKYIRMHLHGNLITDTCSFKKVINHHRWALSIVVGITCAFVVSVMLLVCWVHSYRSRLLFTSYGTS